MQSPKDVALPEFRNMSFVELEDFVNMSSVMIKDYEVQFMNQVQEINKIFADVGNNDSKCENMNRMLNYLRHWQQLIELNISVTNKLMYELEANIIEFEGDGVNNGLQSMLDPLRVVVYPIILKVNEAMTKLITAFEEIMSSLFVSKENRTPDQAKLTQKILDQQLRQLEHLEIMIHKLQKNLQDNNNFCNLIGPSTTTRFCNCL